PASRRAHQQHAFLHPPAHLVDFLRSAQELDDFLYLFLALLSPRNIFKRNFLLLHGKQPGPALAERKSFVSAGLHLADHEEPERSQQNKWSQIQQPRGPASVADVFYGDVDALIAERL